MYDNIQLTGNDGELDPTESALDNKLQLNVTEGMGEAVSSAEEVHETSTGTATEAPTVQIAASDATEPTASIDNLPGMSSIQGPPSEQCDKSQTIVEEEPDGQTKQMPDLLQNLNCASTTQSEPLAVKRKGSIEASDEPEVKKPRGGTDDNEQPTETNRTIGNDHVTEGKAHT